MSDTTMDTMTAAPPRIERKVLTARHQRRKARNDFAAAKTGLDSIRSQFYSGTNRLPNTRSDATRRSRQLIGGPGDRHLTQLDLWTEREISRYLREQSGVFSGMIETWAAEVIQCGFRLQADTGDKALDGRLTETLMGWDGDGGWLNDCDATGRGHFWDLLTLAEETELTDGDLGIYLDPLGNDGRGELSIVEGDRILSPYAYVPSTTTALINGIEVDARGRPIRAFIADEAPSYSFCSIEQGDFYPMFDPAAPERGGLLWSVQPRRFTSTRRQPWLSASIRAHDEIDDVMVAVRIALRNIACRSTYTKIGDYQSFLEWLRVVSPNSEAPAPEDALEHSPNPGDHTYFNPGEEPGVMESNTPGDNFGPFMETQLNMLGLPLGMCLEEALRIFQKSFSASRMAIDGTRRRYERRQRQIKRRKLAPILAFAVARLQAVDELPRDPRLLRIRVGYPGWPYMEPLKDAQASKTLVEARLRSRRTCATEIGDDYDQEQVQIDAEEERYGPPVAAAAAAAGGAASDRDDDTDTEDDGKDADA